MPGSGAFDGDTLAELQQIAGGWAHAIAVEPDPKNYRRLLDRAQREGYGDLECHNLAVSGQPGKLRFRAKAGRHCALTQAGKGVVPVETVDQVFAAALCPERDPVREEVADHVAAFAPAGRETGRDAVRQ